MLDALTEVFLTGLPEYQLVTAKPLDGGLSNRCWYIELKHRHTGCNHQLVWRPTSSATSAFALSRQHEYQLLTGIPAQLAPQPFALLNDGLLVEWVRGETATDALPSKNLIQLQVAIHQLPVPAWRLDVREKAAHYWSQIPSDVKDDTLQAIYRYFQTQSPKQWFSDTCCHHDLGWYNVIIQPGGSAKVIDWEYAAAGDPALDLALTITSNQLDPNMAIGHYCQAIGSNEVKRWQQAVAAWLPWCDFLAMLWFYVGCRLWQDTSYAVEAEKLKQHLISKLQYID
ncbi:phosphotransferase [Photobacterium minamisatsumaniensis]|uniref:phosphotransferase n=1 Tax=Photobacterium minamisatsumaniensis TaxID=2910233 RepID=UPI003D137589